MTHVAGILMEHHPGGDSVAFGLGSPSHFWIADTASRPTSIRRQPDVNPLPAMSDGYLRQVMLPHSLPWLVNISIRKYSFDT